MKKLICCMALALWTVGLLGCGAENPLPKGTQTAVPVQAEMAVTQEPNSLLPETETVVEPTPEVNAEPMPEVQPESEPAEEIVAKVLDIVPDSPPTPKTPQETEPVSSVSEPIPEPSPVPMPAESAPQEPAVPEPIPAPEPEPVWEPVPVVSGDIYSAAEAAQAGDEYARAQYGVTIDTSMTAESASYFPGTADSVAWLASNGGQVALNGAARGNVDATFAALAAMDGAETVSAYARFHCTVRYNAASDEYIVVVLYG